MGAAVPRLDEGTSAQTRGSKTQFTQNHLVSKEGTLMKPTRNATSIDSSLNTTESRNDQEIRLLAFRLYEQRGREPGHEVEDWLQAEMEIATRPTAPSPMGIAA
jgi:hypothetical protein